jgi:hypothetical protein
MSTLESSIRLRRALMDMSITQADVERGDALYILQRTVDGRHAIGAHL